MTSQPETPETDAAAFASPKPLADVRVVAVEQYGAGPFGTMQLAELGADVIKVEDARIGGDVSRYVPPFQEDDESLFFEALNRGKRSISLDLNTTAGREVLHRLVAVSDAVYSNLRGDAPQRLGITYADLQAINPQIVCCNLSGFGADGPRRTDAAYDYMIQSLAGWMSLTGDPDGPPTKTGLSLVDFSGGYVSAMSLVVGVHAARRDGVGMDCDVSLFDVAISMLNYPATWTLTGEYEPTRTANSAHPSIVPFQNFPTADGWITVCCPKQKFWLSLCEALGRADLRDDPKYADVASRRVHREELVAILSDELLTKPTFAWVEIFAEAGVPAAPVHTVREALDDPQTKARDLVVRVDHPRFGPVGHVRGAARAGPLSPLRRSPRRDEHAAEVLDGLLGYSLDERDALAAGGAFGAPPSEPDISDAEEVL